MVLAARDVNSSVAHPRRVGDGALARLWSTIGRDGAMRSPKTYGFGEPKLRDGRLGSPAGRSAHGGLPTKFK
jgi:hypothetical protein